MSRIRESSRNRAEVADRRLLTLLIFYLLALVAAMYFGAARYLPALEPVPASAAVVPQDFRVVSTSPDVTASAADETTSAV
jgi:hypothetical protein